MADKKTVKEKAKVKSSATQKIEKKAVVKKAAPKKAAKSEPVEATVKVAAPKTTRKAGSVSVDVLDTKGKVVESVHLPEMVFAAPINKTLMAQAVRVYLANQRQGTLRTKSRGEVTGSTRKIYRQKGTGRARHGAITAPIFVGGGVAHGPKPRDYSMDLPKKMRKAALFSALTSKLQEKHITVVSGMEKLSAKTKDMALVMTTLGMSRKTNGILLITDNNATVIRASRNLAGVSILPANQLNTYAVLQAKSIVLMKNALVQLEKTFVSKE